MELLPPLVPGKIIGIGLNYRDHAAETGAQLPTRPLLFAKLPTSVVGPAADIVVPPYTDELDYEGELAVVIGRRCRDVAEADALDVVFGYAVMDDVSARDRQREEPQWIRAKGGDAMAPWGPWVTTADEVPDPQALRIRTWVNDDLRQDGTTADMVFGVAREPKAFLRPGDRVRVEIDGLGVLDNPVR